VDGLVQGSPGGGNKHKEPSPAIQYIASRIGGPPCTITLANPLLDTEHGHFTEG